MKQHTICAELVNSVVLCYFSTLPNIKVAHHFFLCGGRKFGPTLCWTLGMTHCKSPNIKYRCLLPCLWIPLSAGVHGKCTIATMFGINRTVIGLVYMFFLVQFEIRNSALSIIVWCTWWSLLFFIQCVLSQQSLLLFLVRKEVLAQPATVNSTMLKFSTNWLNQRLHLVS